MSTKIIDNWIDMESSGSNFVIKIFFKEKTKLELWFSLL
jgi:hypothetical protein